MANLRVKTLPVFIDEMIYKYKIPETKKINNALRAKFVRELNKMGVWEKAKYKTFGRNRTRVFQNEIFDTLEKDCQEYLIKLSGYDFKKFKEHAKLSNDPSLYAYLDDENSTAIQEEEAARYFLGRISKQEILEVMITALFEKYFTEIDIKLWQDDSDFLSSAIDDEDIKLFNYFAASERFNSHNKSAYYKERNLKE